MKTRVQDLPYMTKFVSTTESEREILGDSAWYRIRCTPTGAYWHTGYSPDGSHVQMHPRGFLVGPDEVGV